MPPVGINQKKKHTMCSPYKSLTKGSILIKRKEKVEGEGLRFRE